MAGKITDQVTGYILQVVVVQVVDVVGALRTG